MNSFHLSPIRLGGWLHEIQITQPRRPSKGGFVGGGVEFEKLVSLTTFWLANSRVFVTKRRIPSHLVSVLNFECARKSAFSRSNDAPLRLINEDDDVCVFVDSIYYVVSILLSFVEWSLKIIDSISEIFISVCWLLKRYSTCCSATKKSRCVPVSEWKKIQIF